MARNGIARFAPSREFRLQAGKDALSRDGSRLPDRRRIVLERRA
jgi:hypothetical protein